MGAVEGAWPTWQGPEALPLHGRGATPTSPPHTSHSSPMRSTQHLRQVHNRPCCNPTGAGRPHSEHFRGSPCSSGCNSFCVSFESTASSARGGVGPVGAEEHVVVGADGDSTSGGFAEGTPPTPSTAIHRGPRSPPPTSGGRARASSAVVPPFGCRRFLCLLLFALEGPATSPVATVAIAAGTGAAGRCKHTTAARESASALRNKRIASRPPGPASRAKPAAEWAARADARAASTRIFAIGFGRAADAAMLGLQEATITRASCEPT